MPQVFGPSGANKGFSAFGVHVSFSLNPLYASVLVQDAIAEVKVITVADGVARLIPDIQLVHVNDIDSYHKDEQGQVGPQHTASGLDPQPNPPSIWRPDRSDDDD